MNKFELKPDTENHSPMTAFENHIIYRDEVVRSMHTTREKAEKIVNVLNTVFPVLSPLNTFEFTIVMDLVQDYS